MHEVVVLEIIKTNIKLFEEEEERSKKKCI